MPRQFAEEMQDDMSGGQTDYPDNATPIQSALIENFVIDRDKSIIVRDGCELWNLNALPSSLEALQLFQLEQYIFAYTDDGDVYWTLDDGSATWTKIYTAADIAEDWGTGILEEANVPLYIIPDSAIQAEARWDLINLSIVVSTVADALPNEIQINTLNEATTSLDYFQIEFIYHTGSGSTTFPWTSSHTATLEAGLNGGLPWTVALDETVLNGTSHADINIDRADIIDLTSAGTYGTPYRPVYFYRVKAFADATYNGSLSVSKFAGHLYLALYPDDRSWTPNADDLASTSPDIYEVDNKRVPLRKIYIQYDSVRETSRPRLTSAQMPPMDLAVHIANGGGSTGTGNLYTYEVYARHTYYALVEGEPRQFIVDGPSTRESIEMTNPILDASNQIKCSARMLPRVFMDREIMPLDEMYIEFFRTTTNGSTYYNLESRYAIAYALNHESWKDVYDTSTNVPTAFVNDWAEGDPDSGLFFLGTASDIITDTVIQDGELAYDTGLSQGYTSISYGSHYFTIANQIGYYADIFGLRNRVYASIYGIPHATTALSFLDYDDKITGINTFKDRAVIFTRDTVWRMEGLRGLDGRGAITQRLVSDEFGAISNQSIVRTNYGLFFFSRTGICYSDGYKALRVSEQLYDTYYQWLDDIDFIRGFYYESEQRIYWSVKYQGQSYWVIMHLRYGISPQTPITMATGLEWLNIPVATSSAIIETDRFITNVCHVNETDDVLLRHQSGSILKHVETATTDYYPPNSENIPIVFNYKSRAFDGNTKAHRKWYVNSVFIMNEYLDNGVSVQPTGYNDLASTPQYLAPCFNYDTFDWGDPLQHWGNPNVSWNASKIVKFRRMFPQGSIRATYKQFGIKSMYLYGPDSESHGGATYELSIDTGVHRAKITIPISLATAALEMESGTVDGTGKYAIMLPEVWGNDIWWTIHRVDDNTTTFDVFIDPDTDASNDLTVADTTWTLGYIRTDERVGLDNFTMKYAVIGQYTDGAYDDTDGGDEGK